MAFEAESEILADYAINLLLNCYLVFLLRKKFEINNFLFSLVSFI